MCFPKWTVVSDWKGVVEYGVGMVCGLWEIFTLSFMYFSNVCLLCSFVLLLLQIHTYMGLCICVSMCMYTLLYVLMYTILNRKKKS